MVRFAASPSRHASHPKLQKALMLCVAVSLGGLLLNLLNFVGSGGNHMPSILLNEVSSSSAETTTTTTTSNVASDGDLSGTNAAPSRRLETPGGATAEEGADDVEEDIPPTPLSVLRSARPRLRVLFGIISADSFNDRTYRARHRKLMRLWNDTRICSLPEFQARSAATRYNCQIIYTFVIGANKAGPTEQLDDSRPMLATRPVSGISGDLNDPDMTLLNIKENMNQGKSQTWMRYGAMLAEQYDLDYVVKCDADSILHFHKFLSFAYQHLPPPPYNVNIYAGALRDKAYWPKHTKEEELIRFESYFGNNYEGVHLYIAGQFYLVSRDLAKFIGEEAKNAKPYCEGHEDHDISAMAFHSPSPIHMIPISRPQRFWEHPVKGEPRWVRIWRRETARMSGLPFEGKILNRG